MSTDELIKLIDHHGIDVPATAERVFLIGELLELDLGNDFKSGEDENKNKSESGVVRREFKGPVALPKHYNISFLEVLIRDPLWAFVFWELREHDRDIHEKAEDFEGYCLRAVRLYEEESPETGYSFTVPVGADDNAWHLGFPPTGGVYKVELCTLRNGDEVVLIASRPFRMPKLADMEAAEQKTLARLSGVHDFSLVRSVDRLPRTRGV